MTPSHLLPALLLLSALAVSGCNTIAGAGEDIESGGQAITDTAEDVQDDITE